MTKDALKLALEALVLNNAEWKHLADSGDSGDWSAEDQDHYKHTEEAITAIKEALANEALEKMAENARELGLDYEPEQKPVAWVDPATLHHLKIGLEGVHLVYETEMVNSLPLYDKPQFANSKNYLERLIRIMGTFDLATGHANNFDELLDSLESELRDVLGHYRQQRTWVGLTEDEVFAVSNTMPYGDRFDFAEAIEAKLKEKNT